MPGRPTGGQLGVPASGGGAGWRRPALGRAEPTGPWRDPGRGVEGRPAAFCRSYMANRSPPAAWSRSLASCWPRRIGVPPQQATDLDTATDGVDQDIADRRTAFGQQLVGVAPPISEEDPVPLERGPQDLDQTREVLGAVHVWHHQVPRRPRAISLRQEPIAHPYRLPVRCRYVTRRRFNRGAVPGVPACPPG